MRLGVVIAATLAASITGCADFNRAARHATGDGVVTDDITAFTGARVIRMSAAPVGGAGGMFSACCRIGAMWMPAAPEGAVLNIELQGVAAIKSVSLNLNGQITTLRPVGRYTQMGQSKSAKGFALSWADVERIPRASLAKILVVTYTQGSITGDLLRSDGGMFIDFIPDFIATVRRAHGTP